MEAVQHRRSRTAAVIVLGLVVFPICALPLYVVGHIADDSAANGGFPLGMLLGGVLPPMAAIWLAGSWAAWRWPLAGLLGIACWFMCGAVLLVTFVVVFPAVFGSA